jgi:hypothetical protein
MRHHHRLPSPLLLLAPLLAVGCLERRDEPGERPRVDTRITQRLDDADKDKDKDKPAATVTVDKVKEEPANFYDKDVRVAGKIDQILGDRAFELEGAGWAFNDNITVLTNTPVQFAGVGLTKRDEVIIEGKVRRFVVADLERDLGWDLSPEIEVRLKERPVLVADSIRRVTESGRWKLKADVDEPLAALATIVTHVDPNVLVGKKVDLEHERVQSVMGKGVWIGPNRMSQVYVVPDELPAEIKAGDTVRVRGVLQKVPADAIKAWNLPAEQTIVVNEEMLFVDDAKISETAPGA